MATEDPTAERWLPIPGYEGFYEASDQGRVRSLDRVVRRRGPMLQIGRVLKPFITERGYAVATLCVGRKIERRMVSYLVLSAFVRPPESGEESDHINFTPLDNRPENLRWLSHLENVRHSNAAGHRPKGERHGCAKLTENDVRDIRKRFSGGEAQSLIGAAFGITQSAVSAIVRRHTWSHVA